MDMETAKTWLKNLVLNFLVTKFTKENLKQLCQYILDKAKEKTSQTTTLIDDWCLESFQLAVDDDEKFTAFYNFLAKYILPEDDKTCKAQPVTSEYLELATSIFGNQQDHTCGTINVTQIVTILQYIIPILIEFWKNSQTEETK